MGRKNRLVVLPTFYNRSDSYTNLESTKSIIHGRVLIDRENLDSGSMIVYVILVGLGLLIVVNVPIVPRPDSYTIECNHNSCTTSANYESIYQRVNAPCLLGCDCFCGGMSSVTLSAATLEAGVTESPNSKATAALIMTFTNPGPTTTITFINMTGTDISNVTVWYQQLNSTNPSSFSQVDFRAKYVKGGENALAANSFLSCEFYPWTNSPETIGSGKTYNYIIGFANGESVSGSLVAQ